MIRFITFEGGDGSGKTTQLKALESYLTARGKSCLSTREPGGTSLGEHIRQVLLEVGQQPITSATELFLYLADRAQHIYEVIIPALAQGKIVLCDRHTDSTLAYQGYGRGIDRGLLRSLNDIASQGIEPDLTLLFDCPVEIGLSRTAQRQSKMTLGRSEYRFDREKIERSHIDFVSSMLQDPLKKLRNKSSTLSTESLNKWVLRKSLAIKNK